MVDLENLVPRMMTYNLEHPACHEAGYGEVKRIDQFEYDMGVATPKRKVVTRRVPGSLTFLARETQTGLPNAVLFANEVQAALKAKPPRLRLVQQYEDVPTAPTVKIDPSGDEPVGSQQGSGDQTLPARGSTKKGRE